MKENSRTFKFFISCVHMFISINLLTINTWQPKGFALLHNHQTMFPIGDNHSIFNVLKYDLKPF